MDPECVTLVTLLCFESAPPPERLRTGRVVDGVVDGVNCQSSAFLRPCEKGIR